MHACEENAATRILQEYDASTVDDLVGILPNSAIDEGQPTLAVRSMTESNYSYGSRSISY